MVQFSIIWYYKTSHVISSVVIKLHGVTKWNRIRIDWKFINIWYQYSLHVYIKCIFFVSSPPLNSMMTFWKNIQNKQIKVFNSNITILIVIFYSLKTDKPTKKKEIRTLVKLISEKWRRRPIHSRIMPIGLYQC